MITRLLPTYAAPLTVVGALVVFSALSEYEPWYFTRDPASTAEHPFYLGWFSNIGIAVWVVAAAVPLFVARVLGPVPGRGILVAGGTISTVFFLDDLYQLHETVIPYYVGVPQKLILAAYAAGMLWFLYRFRTDILNGRSSILLSAVAFLGASVGIDLLEKHLALPMHHVFEDGAKFLGICGWAAFLAGTAADRLAERLEPAG